MTTSEVLRIMLLFTIVSMAFLALFYLSRRRLAWPDLLAWGLLAVLVPILGPFVVLSLHPGQSQAALSGVARSDARRATVMKRITVERADKKE